MDEGVIAAYLRRLRVSRPQVVDAPALRLLHRAHQIAVPFENLSIHPFRSNGSLRGSTPTARPGLRLTIWR